MMFFQKCKTRALQGFLLGMMTATLAAAQGVPSAPQQARPVQDAYGATPRTAATPVYPATQTPGSTLPAQPGSSVSQAPIGSAVASPVNSSSTQPMNSSMSPSAVPATTQPLQPGVASPTSSAEMLVGQGDLLEVSVYGAPEYLRQVRVGADGNIALPLIGNVHVAGLKIADAEKTVAQRLSEGGYFNNPNVSILEKEFATQGISLMGEVQRPGIYPMPGAHSLFDALSAAGGTTPRAGNIVSITHRGHPESPEVVTLTYDGKPKSQSNVEVYPGDTIVVSKAGVIYVVGDVHLPSGFVMENSRMTILQALAMAQGPNPTASLDHAKLVRQSPNGPQEVPVSLKAILTAKAPDMPLQAEDILFVPTSKGKSAARTTLNAIVQAATGMATYGRF